MRRSTLLSAMAPMLWISVAAAQTTLGDLLAANAHKLSPEQFKQEVVERRLTGPTPNGGRTELMYLSSGLLHGTSLGSSDVSGYGNPLEGQWTTDESGRICTAVRMSGGPRMATAVVVPPRCQYWFKLGDKYYLSDSDYDRSAKVLERTVTTTAARAPANLGELLAAGGKPVSGAEFRAQVVQRTVAGVMSPRVELEVMYAASGTIVGTGYEPGDYRRLGINGTWTIDDRGRICSTMRIAGVYSALLPARCEYWFRLGDSYYLADSDSDRNIKLTTRTLKP